MKLYNILLKLFNACGKRWNTLIFNYSLLIPCFAYFYYNLNESEWERIKLILALLLYLDNNVDRNIQKQRFPLKILFRYLSTKFHNLSRYFQMTHSSHQIQLDANLTFC